MRHVAKSSSPPAGLGQDMKGKSTEVQNRHGSKKFKKEVKNDLFRCLSSEKFGENF